MGELDAAGDLALGGMLARAAEPLAGEGDGHTHERNCLNCGCALTGEYCHCCGQKAHVHRTIGAFFHDIAHGVFHFEGKIWRTLPMLAWRPGELTRRYVEGERARFVSPIALFLFTVFLLFATFSALGVGKVDSAQFQNVRTEMRSTLEREEKSLAAMERRRAALPRTAGQGAAAALDRELADQRQDVAALRTFVQSTKPKTSQLVGGKTGWARLDNGLEKLNANPALALYKVQTNAYKFSWALIPISVPFVWLLFLHRRRYRRYKAYDHVVFVTYSIAFMSIALIVLALLKTVPNTEGIRIAMILIPPLHMYRQLRGAYQLGRWSAIWRTGALLVFAFTAIVLFLLLLLALGVFG
jgi:hypothetical protein